MSEQTFTDDNFADAVVAASKEKAVLVDFYADWCGPCKMQGPIVDELAEEMGDKAVIGKINVDESPKAAQEYGVMGIPALKIFRNGEVVQEFTGLQTKEVLKEALETHA
jgi:thioredoxin 1